MSVTVSSLEEEFDNISLMRTSELIQAEIQRKFGFIPPFFMPAEPTPQVLENLWQQTLSAYVNNPLPALFKERLSAYLSRFCAVPYCMICHSCSLYGLGVKAPEVLALLEAPPPSELTIDQYLQQLEEFPQELSDWSDLSAELEAKLLECAIFIALQTDAAEYCRSKLRQLLGAINYHFLVTFIAYVKTCHVWMESHPEVAYQADKRVQDYFQALVEDAPALADFFANYWERVKRDRQSWAEQQAAIAERKRNEAALRKAASENRYLAQAIASTSHGVLITDPNQLDNPIIYCNPAFSRITGYESEEVIGRNCRFLQGENTDRQVIAQIRQAVYEQREVNATLLNYRKDGQPFWNESHIAPVFSESEELLYFIGIQTDISDRKRAEEALRQSESTLRSFFNNTSMMMGVVELREDDILHISDNADAARLLGQTPETMQNRLASELGVPQTVVQQWVEYYREAERTQHPVRFEYLYKTPQQEFWLSATVSVISDIDDHPTRFAYVVADITEQKQAEAALERQAAMLQKQAQLLDVATDAIFVQNLQYQVLFWNKGAERLYEWQKEEVLGENAFSLLQQEGTFHLREAQKVVLEQGEWQGELHLSTKSGKKLVVASRWTLVRGDDQQPKSILVVNTDITEKKQLESQFLRAQRMESIGTLASGIAHDLNNVLTPILSSAQLLLMQTPQEQAKQRRLLETVQNSARRGSALIKQVLSFARGIEGQRTVLQVRHLIAEIRQIAQETFPKSIEVHLDLANDLWLVAGDATQLHQVMMNLCVNARDAMPDGGTLSLSATNLWIDEHYARMNLDAQVGPHIVVTIADTGMGISSNILDRIFEPFFTTKELGKGTGLGLSTVMGIIRSHGGFIEVTSAIGEGTQFKICLPAVRADETPQTQEDELTRGQGELVLVVDDEAAIREVSQASLEAYNYRVITATDGIDAIALYVEHRHEISLVLIDLMMPSMDGPTTIRTLRKLNPNVKVVATSGLMSSNQLAEAISPDIQAFLPKPYTAKELIKHINTVLGNT